MNFDQSDGKSILVELGLRLKRARLNQNITQQGLSEKVGLSRTQIQSVEGGRNYEMETFLRILRGLNVLSKLESFLPDPGISPLQLKKLAGKRRQRARKGSS